MGLTDFILIPKGTAFGREKCGIQADERQEFSGFRIDPSTFLNGSRFDE
jgi:hypothetical protein